MSLETYVKQLTTWQEINEDIPEFAKYHELIEELKKNKDIKGLQKFLADHILPPSNPNQNWPECKEGNSPIKWKVW